jgi:hypothetical protein
MDETDATLAEITAEVTALKTELGHLYTLRGVAAECLFGDLVAQLDRDIASAEGTLAAVGRLLPELA